MISHRAPWLCRGRLLLQSLLLLQCASTTLAGHAQRASGKAPAQFAPENAAGRRLINQPVQSKNGARYPYNPDHKPWPIPGVIEAENFDEGTAADPAYFDDSPGSAAPADEVYRKSDVDIGVDSLEHLADVGWVDAGEWLEYTVNVEQSGLYTIHVRIATPKQGKTFHFEFNGKSLNGSVKVPLTGCWGSDLHGHDCFQEAVVPHVRLEKGIARMRFVPEGAKGDKDLFTVDRFKFESEGTTR